jgi:hypothetical protein
MPNFAGLENWQRDGVEPTSNKLELQKRVPFQG